MQVLVHTELLDVLREEVGAVRDRVVVEHARERRGSDDRFHVRLHLAPLALVHVRRKSGQAGAPGALCRASELHRLVRAERGDPGHQRDLVADRRLAAFEDLHLLIEGQSSRLTQRAERHDAVGIVLDQPGDVIAQAVVVHREILTEGSRDRGENSPPVSRSHVGRVKGSGDRGQEAGNRRQGYQ